MSISSWISRHTKRKIAEEHAGKKQIEQDPRKRPYRRNPSFGGFLLKKFPLSSVALSQCIKSQKENASKKKSCRPEHHADSLITACPHSMMKREKLVSNVAGRRDVTSPSNIVLMPKRISKFQANATECQHFSCRSWQ